MRKSLYFVVKRGSKRNNARQNFHQFFNFENFSLILRLSLLVDARCKKNSEDFRLYHPRFVFYQKNEGNVYFTFSGFNSHREIRTIYLTTTYPRFQRWDGGGGSIWIAFDQTSWPGNRLRHVSWNTFSRLHWSQVESVPSRKTKNAIYPSKTRDSCSRLGTKYFNAIASNHTWQISRDKTPWIFNNNSKKEKKNSKLPIPSFKKKNIFFFPPPSLFSTEIFHAGTKSGRFDK